MLLTWTMQKQHRVSATPNIQSVWNKFCSDELIQFSCKLLFCKIQNHYRGHEKSENRDLKRRKLYTLILTLWNSYVKSVIIHLWRQVKAHLSKTRKNMQEKQTCAKNKKKKFDSKTDTHASTQTTQTRPSSKWELVLVRFRSKKTQILVFKLEFTIKKHALSWYLNFICSKA